jgi:hypothetical protein
MDRFSRVRPDRRGKYKAPLQLSLTDNVITITTAPAPEKKAVDATPPKPENGGK